MKRIKTYNQLFENQDKRNTIITQIKLILKYSDDGSYSSADLELDSDPIYNDTANILIDVFNIDYVHCTVYGGYKMEQEVSEFDANYTKLDDYVLETIIDNLLNGVEFEKITYNNIPIIEENDYNDMLILLTLSEFKNINDILNLPKTYDRYLLIMKKNKYKI